MQEKKMIQLDKNVELKYLFPEFMMQDKNFRGITYALENEIKRITEYFDLLKIFINIDKLPEKILDELAWQFNVVEYRHDDHIDIKRSLIKGCMDLHHKRGTVAAVEEIVAKVYGNAEIEEWFDYGGDPYHFRIRTANINSTDEMIQRVTDIVSKTQNVRSYLEEVIVDVMQQLKLFHGCKIMLDSDCTTIGIDMKF